MPEYKQNASGAAWVVLRSWAGVRETLKELEKDGQDVAAFRVRTGPGDAAETRADEHPETRTMEAFRGSESEKVQPERPESGSSGAAGHRAGGGSKSLIADGRHAVSEPGVPLVEALVEGDLAPKVEVAPLEEDGTPPSAAAAASGPGSQAESVAERDDLEGPPPASLQEMPVFNPPAAASREEAPAPPRERLMEAISGHADPSVTDQFLADSAGRAGHKSPWGTLPKAIHGVSWPKWLPSARLSRAAVALVGGLLLLIIVRLAPWSDARRIEPFVGRDLALQHVAGDTTGCLDVWWGRAEDGNKVQTWTCNDSDAQIWRLEKRSDGDHSGRYRLVSALANGGRYCLDGRNRSRMEIWRCVGREDVEATYQSFDLSSSRGGWTMTFRFEAWSALMLAERDVSDPRGSVGQRRRVKSVAAVWHLSPRTAAGRSRGRRRASCRPHSSLARRPTGRRSQSRERLEAVHA